ncbi:hypothetical protein [Paenibacillus sp. Marseille-Q4541]|uniref:hypothetical protein n=1 Tax=Paenibacillus sp. Marseille-Q4541 TaxID=2831522 RepID=UPI001BAA0583|nr:hypothetical protein [Paenibacillus sp. Marseille-Q4541]
MNGIANNPFWIMDDCLQAHGKCVGKEQLAFHITTLPREIKILAMEWGWNDPEVLERIDTHVSDKK